MHSFHRSCDSVGYVKRPSGTGEIDRLSGTGGSRKAFSRRIEDRHSGYDSVKKSSNEKLSRLHDHGCYRTTEREEACLRGRFSIDNTRGMRSENVLWQ